VSEFPLVKLSELAEISGGITKNSKRSALPIQRPYLAVANVYANRLDLEKVGTIGVNEVELGRSELKDGDLLVVEGNGSLSQLGRVALWRDEIKGCLHQNHIIKVRPGEQVESKWILYWLMSSAGRRAIEAVGSSTSGLHTLSLSKVSSLPTPLASKEVQYKAIAYIELHLSRLDETVATLEAIRAKLKQARASILKAAVEGRLVDAKPTLHDGQLGGQTLTSVEVGDPDRSSTAGKLSKKTVSFNVPADVASAPLPHGWRWTTVDQESIFLKYGTSAKCGSDPDGVPVIRMGNIQDGAVVMDSIKYLPFDHAEFPDQLLTRGELLFNRTNSSDLVGKTAVFHGSQLHACASYIIRVKLKDTVLPELVAYNLNGPSGRAWAQAVASQQVGQANINSQKLRAFYFALPPFEAQERIIAEVERRFSVLDHVEATVQASLARCALLRQAILKRAFEGRLKPAPPEPTAPPSMPERSP
jgi:type I restriction enzyme S subunit